jgi:hypothetical protein
MAFFGVVEPARHVLKNVINARANIVATVACPSGKVQIIAATHSGRMIIKLKPPACDGSIFVIVAPSFARLITGHN